MRKRLAIMAALLAPWAGRACAVCAGNSDAPAASGLNWGILGLLGVILIVLAWFVGFFVYLARRAAQARADESPDAFVPEPSPFAAEPWQAGLLPPRRSPPEPMERA